MELPSSPEALLATLARRDAELDAERLPVGVPPPVAVAVAAGLPVAESEPEAVPDGEPEADREAAGEADAVAVRVGVGLAVEVGGPVWFTRTVAVADDGRAGFVPNGTHPAPTASITTDWVSYERLNIATPQNIPCNT